MNRRIKKKKAKLERDIFHFLYDELAMRDFNYNSFSYSDIRHKKHKDDEDAISLLREFIYTYSPEYMERHNEILVLEPIDINEIRKL
jgi:hypothetical protein